MRVRFLTIFMLFNLSLTTNLFAGKKIRLLKPLNQCPEFDNTKNFGPIRDQNGHGYCWSFAATSLLEEQLCLQNSKYCKRQLSVIDATRCAWDENSGLGSKSEGGSPFKIFECVNRKKEGGVCLEEDAPYDNRAANCFLFASSPECTHSKARDLYDDWIDFKNRICNKNLLPSEVAFEFAQKMGKIINKLEKYFPNHKELGVDFAKFDEAQNSTEFLKNILITDKCKKNRIPFKFKYKDTILRNIDEQLNDESMKIAKERFLAVANTKKSLILGYCDKSSAFFSEKCEGHALVVNGMKLDDGVCKVHLRNSWGVGATFNGWYNLDEVVASTLYIEYIE